MDPIAVVTLCRQLGCCDACCLRFLGLKSPKAYEDASKYILKYQDKNSRKSQSDVSDIDTKEKGDTEDGKDSGSPPAKRQRMNVCVCCLGILQPDSWPSCFEKVKEVLNRKRYECTTFACALSSPLSILIREKAILLRIKQLCSEYDINTLTPLKEAWKWSFGCALAAALALALGSGADTALLVTLHMEYGNDAQEMEALKSLCPALFAMRAQQRQRFTALVTRPAAEQALEGVSLEALTALEGWASIPAVEVGASCASVEAAHAPVYLAGRYVKRSRTLPQTPWLVEGRRMMESSVQEIIARPTALLYQLDAEATSRIKFVSAGREDVDVRCLGDGRPFALEIADPPRLLTAAELSAACEQINQSGDVNVASLQYVTREELGQLKKGEESKAKTYHALCIKLTHHKFTGPFPTKVTPEDIARMNSYSNTAEEGVRIKLAQRTPLRVLHRRPLLERQRNILELEAKPVPSQPHLFCIRVVTEAGTYVKEWVHGECGRTTPSLADALRGHQGTGLNHNNEATHDNTSDGTLAKASTRDEITNVKCNVEIPKEINHEANGTDKVSAMEDHAAAIEQQTLEDDGNIQLVQKIDHETKTEQISSVIGDAAEKELNRDTAISAITKTDATENVAAKVDHMGNKNDSEAKTGDCMEVVDKVAIGDKQNNVGKAVDCITVDEMAISVDIVALDVVGVHLAWPPPRDT